MAIDDNTSYELTGAQVKDLASKIKAKADSSSLATVATTGNYNDLTNQPTIPTVNDATLTIQQNGTSVGTFTANASSNATISLTDTTYSAMIGASSGAAGTSGLVPAPAAGDESKVLSGAGTWVNQSGGGSSTVIYYANSTSTAGFQSGTINGPYIYKDAARTTIATPGEIYDNFQAGNTIHIEYESTQTGASAFAMTLEVATMSLNGSDTYSMVVNEVNEETQGDSRDLVMLRLYAYWDGQSTFSSRWTQQRKYVNDGTLTIQHNGTTKGTFTANQSSASTVNIETIYADTISPATAVDPITASMIAGGASPETLANGSVVEIIGTTTGDNQNYCIKYADGRLIAIIRKTFSNAAFSAWGSCYGHEFGAGWLGNYAVAFAYKPVVNCYATSSAALWVCVDTGNDNESLTAAPTVGLVRPSTNTAVSGAMHLIAYGFWK